MIKSDIYGLNGVIHIVDAVLVKKRDFKVNGAQGAMVTSPLVVILLTLASLTMAKFF